MVGNILARADSLPAAGGVCSAAAKGEAWTPDSLASSVSGGLRFAGAAAWRAAGGDVTGVAAGRRAEGLGGMRSVPAHLLMDAYRMPPESRTHYGHTARAAEMMCNNNS